MLLLIIILEGIIVIHLVGCGFALVGLAGNVNKTLKHIGIVIGIIGANIIIITD